MFHVTCLFVRFGPWHGFRPLLIVHELTLRMVFASKCEYHPRTPVSFLEAKCAGCLARPTFVSSRCCLFSHSTHPTNRNTYINRRDTIRNEIGELEVGFWIRV